VYLIHFRITQECYVSGPTTSNVITTCAGCGYYEISGVNYPIIGSYSTFKYIPCSGGNLITVNVYNNPDPIPPPVMYVCGQCSYGVVKIGGKGHSTIISGSCPTCDCYDYQFTVESPGNVCWTNCDGTSGCTLYSASLEYNNTGCIVQGSIYSNDANLTITSQSLCGSQCPPPCDVIGTLQPFYSEFTECCNGTTKYYISSMTSFALTPEEVVFFDGQTGIPGGSTCAKFNGEQLTPYGDDVPFDGIISGIYSNCTQCLTYHPYC
jgi:hypothetical protein